MFVVKLLRLKESKYMNSVLYEIKGLLKLTRARVHLEGWILILHFLAVLYCIFCKKVPLALYKTKWATLLV